YAASGHAAAPPSSVMNWRRLSSSMGSSPEPAEPAYRRLRMPWKHPQVLGLDLNRSEISWLKSEAAGSPVFSSQSSAKQKKPAHDRDGNVVAQRHPGDARTHREDLRHQRRQGAAEKGLEQRKPAYHGDQHRKRTVTLNDREGWEGGEEEQHSRGHHHQTLTDA